MSSVLTAATETQLQRRSWHGAALQGFGRRHWAMLLGFTIGTPLVYALFSIALGDTVLLKFMVYEFASCFAIGLAALASAVAADNLLRERLAPAARVAVAIGVAALGGTLLIQVVDIAVAVPLELERHLAKLGKGFADSGHRLAYQIAGALRWSMVLVVLYELLEASRRSTDALHAVQMSALSAERDLVEGELRTMQARVDPDLLFDSLLDIDRAYARSVATGQEQLDALIGFLRAALPGDGNGGSSVAREQALVEAYVGLLNERGENRLELELAVAPAAQHQPMPAMLLLPLVKWAIAAGETGRLSVTIESRPGALAAVVDSDARGTDSAPETEIAAVRERLRQLYASAATLRAQALPGARRAELTIPL